MSEARAGRAPQGRVGTAVNGKWQIDARIGSGGMATVYAATHRNGHRAALKMLHLNLSRDPSTRARFLREGYVANAVGHPGVVAVLDDGIAEDGAAFLVLELLEGETIDARRVRLGGTLPVDEALDLADQALDALAAAHAKGIVHRDVKPENVFLTNEGTIKLLDFGLARMKDFEAERTKTGVTIGTPEFMPPEQAMGRRDEVDARSDVWALGATLYKALTGQYVHDAQTVHEQLIASATRRSRPIRQIAQHLSPAVAQVIDRSLELEKSDRWQSATEMQAALRAARQAANPPGYFDDSHTVALPNLDRVRGPDSDRGGDRGELPSESISLDSTMAMSEPALSVTVEDAPKHEEHGPFSPRTARMQPRIEPDESARHPPPSNPQPQPLAPYPYTPRNSTPPPYSSRDRNSTPPPYSSRDAKTVHRPRSSGPSNSAKAVLYVSLVLVVLCATMGAYVLWRGGAPAP